MVIYVEHRRILRLIYERERGGGYLQGEGNYLQERRGGREGGSEGGGVNIQGRGITHQGFTLGYLSINMWMAEFLTHFFAFEFYNFFSSYFIYK